MTYILAIDPSLTVCGYCIMSDRKKIVKLGQYIVNKELPFAKKIASITDELMKLAKNNSVTELIIEDIYYNKNVMNVKRWGRLSGALMYAWYRLRKKETDLLMACSARPKIGLKGNAQKIEVQLHAARLFGLVDDSTFYSYCGKIGNYLQQMKADKINKKEYKKRLVRLSKEFEEETKISEHIADSIVLALAWIEMNMVK